MAVINGTSGADTLNDTFDNDTINGLAGNDTINGSNGGDDVVNGGDGRDSLQFMNVGSAVFADFVAGTVTGWAGTTSFTNIEKLVTGDHDDLLTGNGAAQNLTARAGDDTLAGGGGIDTLWGGADNDTFVFRETGTANADAIGDWTSGQDTLLLDGAVMTALGASGDFTAGDTRFWASSSGTAHDADDRIIFNTSTRQIFYDADGNGSGAAQLIATLQTGATLVATDITVEGSGPIVGTDGNDWLDGTVGDDTINGLGGRDTIHGGDGDDVMDGGSGNDFLNGGEGADTFIGGEGNDTLYSENSPDDGDDFHVETLDGGLGDDRYIVDHASDVLIDAGGIDTVQVWTMDWTLGAGFENLELASGPTESSHIGIGNELDNHMSLSYAGALHGREGDDTLVAGIGEGGEQHLFGDAGDDLLLAGTSFDVLDGGAGQDTLLGQSADWEFGEAFVFSATPGSANADVVINFDGFGVDSIVLDGTVMPEIGGTGRFDEEDARFAANSTGTAWDSSDRVIYNTSTGELWYDADGAGTGEAALIATLQGAPEFASWDIVVVNGAADQVINGTAGDDSLTGGEGYDTINGLGGNDTLDGAEGNDSLVGGDGDDLLIGDQPNWTSGADTLDGGLGNDTYRVADGDVLVSDPGGFDQVFSTGHVRLAAGMENLALVGNSSDTISGFGNDLVNVLRSELGSAWLFGGGGNDTIFGGGYSALPEHPGDRLGGDDGDDEIHGGAGQDELFGGAGNDLLFGDEGADTFFADTGNDTMLGGAGHDLFVMLNSTATYGQDSIDGGAGVDGLFLHGVRGESAVVIDLAAGIATGGGPGGSGSVQFTSIERAFGSRFDDVLTGSSNGGERLHGQDGNDTIDGAAGGDTLQGEGGADTFLFTAAPGIANMDQIVDFASGMDEIRLDATVMSALGASGEFSASDARFYAAAGANAGHDADDRVIYNTNTGELWYDADGSGTASAQIIALLWDTPALTATDIAVVNGSASGQVINGTSGADTLADTAGNDTINGLAGNDTINGGHGGNDIVNGGDGRDSLQFMTATGAVVVDFVAGVAGTTSFTNIEKVVTGDFNDRLIGDAAAQNLTARAGSDTLAGAGGVDTLWGGAGADTFIFRETGTANADTIGDWTSGSDEIELDNAAMAALGADGDFVAGDARFWASSTGLAHDANDRVLFNTSNRGLYYDADGTGSSAAQLIATLQAGATVVATDISVI